MDSASEADKTHDPHPKAALLDAAVVLAEPPPDLLRDVPARVVPQMSSRTFFPAASSFSRLHSRNRVAVWNSPAFRPRTSVHVSSNSGRGRVRSRIRPSALKVIFGNRPLDEARRRPLLGPGVQGGKRHPAPPALVTEADGPLGISPGGFHQSIAPPFFLSYRGSGEVIHRLGDASTSPREGAIGWPGWSPPRLAPR
jgi:hypothetical protein